MLSTNCLPFPTEISKKQTILSPDTYWKIGLGGEVVEKFTHFDLPHHGRLQTLAQDLGYTPQSFHPLCNLKVTFKQDAQICVQKVGLCHRRG